VRRFGGLGDFPSSGKYFTGTWIRAMRYAQTTAQAIVGLSLALAAFNGFAFGGDVLDDRLGIRTAPLFLLLRADIQGDLGLDPKQIAQCKQAAQAFYERALQVRGITGQGTEAARRDLNGRQTHWLQAALQPAQLARLEKIELQWEGARAMLNRPLLDDALKLTPEQRQKVSALLKAADAERGQGPWLYEQHTELTRQAIAVLNEHQKELWIHLLGPACKFKIGQPAVSSAATTDKTVQPSGASAPSRTR
jgi:hypothetical protein